MKEKKYNGGYIVVLERGENVIKTLSNFAVSHNIGYASLSGVGALKNIQLGYFNLEKKEYQRCFFPAEYELLNLTGNISWASDAPLVHCHVTIADPEFFVRGGHLFEADVGVTLELFVTVLENRISRKKDDFTGLNLLEL